MCTQCKPNFAWWLPSLKAFGAEHAPSTFQFVLELGNVPTNQGGRVQGSLHCQCLFRFIRGKIPVPQASTCEWPEHCQCKHHNTWKTACIQLFLNFLKCNLHPVIQITFLHVLHPAGICGFLWITVFTCLLKKVCI